MKCKTGRWYSTRGKPYLDRWGSCSQEGQRSRPKSQVLLNCPALFPLPGTRNREEWERLPCGCPAGRGDQPRPGISLKVLGLGDNLRKSVSTPWKAQLPVGRPRDPRSTEMNVTLSPG